MAATNQVTETPTSTSGGATKDGKGGVKQRWDIQYSSTEANEELRRWQIKIAQQKYLEIRDNRVKPSEVADMLGLVAQHLRKVSLVMKKRFGKDAQFLLDNAINNMMRDAAGVLGVDRNGVSNGKATGSNGRNGKSVSGNGHSG